MHIGNTNNYFQLNWQACRDKLTKVLARWRGLSKYLSYKGRVLIANQLASSQILHIFAVLSPPDHILTELQNKLIDFVWSGGRHWLKKDLLYKNPQEGGLGLTCLQARILTYRFSVLQKFLQRSLHPSFQFLKHYFHQYRRLQFDFQLFCINLEKKILVNLPTFHSDVLRAWMTLGARIVTQPDCIDFVKRLPLNAIFLNEFITDEQTLLSSRLLAYGIKLVGDTFDWTSGVWFTAQHLQERVRFPSSTRILQAELIKLHKVLVRAFPHLFNSTGYRLSTRHLQDSGDLQALQLEIQIDPDCNITNSPSRIIYQHMNRQMNSLENKTCTYWHTNGVIPVNQVIPWKQIYHLPVSKREANTQFRLLHNILPSLTVLHHFKPNISPMCAWCGQKGTTLHLFIECPSIQPALNLLHFLLHGTIPDVTLDFDVYWSLLPYAKGRSKRAVCIFNYLIMSLKSTIYSLYLEQSTSDPLIVWKFRLKCKILIEFHYYQSQNNLQTFLQKWSHNYALFHLSDDKLTWMF